MENPYARIVGYQYALVGEERVLSEGFHRLFHGTSEESKETVAARPGLPRRGDNLDLLNHAEPSPAAPKSAFRGCVQFALTPDKTAGAALWADDGGTVFQIEDYRGYDVNKLLEGRIATMSRYRDPLWKAEQEIAIPAEVPIQHVKRTGLVIQRTRGLTIDWDL
jgi:hypothetical protein